MTAHQSVKQMPERSRRHPDLQRTGEPAAPRRGVLAHDGFRLLVVDDGSPDGTGAVADALGAAISRARVEVMHRTGARGLGRSYIDGLRIALAREDADLICQMDADLSHDPQYLPALAAAAADHDVVIGSRYLNGVSVVNWPLHRIFLSAFANRYIRAVTSLSPRDCTSGFRCWRREALARLPLDRDGVGRLRVPRRDAVRSEARNGCRIGEVPIIFVERRQGQSKVSTAVLLESLIMPWRLLFRAAALTHAPRRRHGDDVVPAIPGDSVGTFMEPIAHSVAARGHEVHVVAPWHPRVARGEREGRRAFSFLQVRAASGAERVRLRGGDARGRHAARRRVRSPRRWRWPPDGAPRGTSRDRHRRHGHARPLGRSPAA